MTIGEHVRIIGTATTGTVIELERCVERVLVAVRPDDGSVTRYVWQGDVEVVR